MKQKCLRTLAEKENSKYLGIFEANTFKETEINAKVRKYYLRRIINPLETKICYRIGLNFLNALFDQQSNFKNDLPGWIISMPRKTRDTWGRPEYTAALESSSGLRGGILSGFYLLQGVGFIAWRLRHPKKWNADGGRRYFWPCRTRVGFGPATGPTLKTALCHIRALVGRMINNQSIQRLKHCVLTNSNKDEENSPKNLNQTNKQ